MIRNISIFAVALTLVASCASKSSLDTGKSFAPANFVISDVFVNMSDGIENSRQIRSLMRNASRNTVKLYNKNMASANENYPLEIEVREVNYRDPKATASSGDRTYIKYTMTLREEASGEVFRSLPVTYFHVSTGALTTAQAKQNADKNMIRLSMKNSFARLYGMKNVPQNVQSFFNTKDVFAKDLKTPARPTQRSAPKPVKKEVPLVETPVASAPSPQPAPKVVNVPEAPVIQASSNNGEPDVIKCVVC